MPIDIPRQFIHLFEPHRFKSYHGGRSGCKSWSFAVAEIVLMALHNPNNSAEDNLEIEKKWVSEYGIDPTIIRRALRGPIRVLNCREIQNSIEESAKKVLADTVSRLGLTGIFDIMDRTIKCKNGSQADFIGLFRNVDKVKSAEGYDFAIVWEAQPLSDESIDILIPTIRTENRDESGNITFQSEIWFEYNPKYPDDPVHKRFTINKPDNCLSVSINYDDVLPYVPQVMINEAEACKKANLAQWKQIWHGETIGAGAKIWHNFSRDIHVKPFDLEKHIDAANLYMSMDPHSRYFPACLWCAKIPKDRRKTSFWYVIYDEYPRVDDMGGNYSDLRKKIYFTERLQDLAKNIYARDKVRVYGHKVRKRFLDTRFAKGAGGANWSTSTVGLVEEFAKHENGGILFDTPPERIIDVQRDVIIDALGYNQFQPITEDNSPSLVILPHCLNLIESMENHRCVEGEEKEDEKYKDFSDALRILFAGMSMEAYSDPNPSEEPEIITVTDGAEFGLRWMA